MGKEITIWTSEPDYEDVRKDMEEDFPEMSEADRMPSLSKATSTVFSSKGRNCP